MDNSAKDLKPIAAPDGKKDYRGKIFRILPERTLLRERYEVSYLTSGGMGVIYNAKDTRTGLDCIIKEIIYHMEEGENVHAKSFLREKEMLSKFYHPGIVNLLDFFQENNAFYLVLEFVDGLPADEYIVKNYDKERIPVNTILYWSLQICKVLEYLHNMKPPVIYRDLKPENILIDKNGKIKLIDFGIARTYKEEQLKDTEAVGSFGFASPEQYGAKQTDGRSDIYSFGVFLHYLLTGLDPREKEKPFLFDSVRLHNSNVPVGIEAVVIKCLMLRPKDRFQTVEELKGSLEKIACNYPFEEDISCEKDISECEEDISEEEITQKSPSYMKRTAAYILLDIIFLGLICWFLIPVLLELPGRYFRGASPEQGWLARCENNIKILATALEMYATDNTGTYPQDLTYLTKGNYIESLPHCPYNKKEYSYVAANKPDYFTLWCSVPGTHKCFPMSEKPEEAYPQYTPEKGLMLGNEKE